MIVLRVLYFAVQIYWWILLFRIILSWINPDPNNPVVRFLFMITDPPLDLARKLVPIRIGMLDLSPLVLFLILGGIMWVLNALMQ